MGQSDRRIDVWMSKRSRWQEPLSLLRAMLLETSLRETFKWRGPVYAAQDGGNVVNLFDMKAFCGLGFFKGVLLDDPKGLLQSPGPNSHHVMRACFASVSDVEAEKEYLAALIAQAIINEANGLRVDTRDRQTDIPDALADALAQDDALAKAFDALTPGRRRGYALIIGQAKQLTTRQARVAKYRDRILAGLGPHDR